MKPRHAAALALVGWVVMYPPIIDRRNGPPIADKNAPFSEWEQGGRIFKSKENCEAFAAKESEEAQKPATGEMGSLQARFRWALRSMKTMCVSNDDPRLKGN